MLSTKLTRYFRAPRILGSCVNYCIGDKNVEKNSPVDALTSVESNEKGKHSKITNKKRFATNVIEPALACERRKEIQCVVGIHLGPKSLYWAKVSRDGELLEWNNAWLFPTVESGRKMSLPKLYAMIDHVSERIPFSDIFVLESSNKMVTSVSSQAVIANAIFQSQMIAVLLTILNSRLEGEDNVEDYYHKVFLMRPRIVSRFFNLLVGTERVSALALVDSILGDKNSLSLSISEIMDESEKGRGEGSVNADISAKPSFPLYTPVKASSSVIEYYRTLEAVEREAMSQALLITMAFYDLVVFKDPKVMASFERKGVVNKIQQPR